jgi:hypothetical protein
MNIVRISFPRTHSIGGRAYWAGRTAARPPFDPNVQAMSPFCLVWVGKLSAIIAKYFIGMSVGQNPQLAFGIVKKYSLVLEKLLFLILRPPYLIRNYLLWVDKDVIFVAQSFLGKSPKRHDVCLQSFPIYGFVIAGGYFTPSPGQLLGLNLAGKTRYSW